VFRAIQRSTGRTVALKVLRNGLLASDTDRTRLKREAEILLHLNQGSSTIILSGMNSLRKSGRLR